MSTHQFLKKHTTLSVLSVLMFLCAQNTSGHAADGTELQEDNILDNPNSSRIVVLTFDDASRSNRTFVAPLLKELGFGATFFISHL